MKQRLNLICAAILCVSSAMSQTVTREVTATSGGNFENANYSLNWTLGEPVIDTYITSPYQVRQGFQQGVDYAIPLEINQLPELTVSIFPNPTVKFLTIECVCNPCKLHYYLTNSIGEIILSGLNNNNKFQLDLSPFANTVYNLTVYSTDYSKMKSFQIIKY